MLAWTLDKDELQAVAWLVSGVVKCLQDLFLILRSHFLVSDLAGHLKLFEILLGGTQFGLHPKQGMERFFFILGGCSSSALVTGKPRGNPLKVLFVGDFNLLLRLYRLERLAIVLKQAVGILSNRIEFLQRLNCLHLFFDRQCCK